MSGILIILHQLAAVFWVGGMAFAYFCLRPGLAELDANLRLRLFRAVLGRFLPGVFVAVIVLLISGYGLLFGRFGGFGGAPVYVHIMHLTGWVMFLLFFHLYFAAWRRLDRAAVAGDGAAAAKAAGQVRQIVVIALVLGVLTVAVATGRYWLA